MLRSITFHEIDQVFACYKLTPALLSCAKAPTLEISITGINVLFV